MKRLLYIALVVVIAVVLGCGGGGGGGGGTGSNPTTGTTGAITSVTLEALFAGTQATPNTAELAAGNTLTLELIGTESSGDQVLLSGSFSTSAPSSVATVSGSQLKIVGGSSGKQYTVSGVYKGSTYQISFTSTPATAQVSGSIRDENDVNISGAEVEFFSSAGTLVGETTSNSTGQFEANVPTSAVGFSVQLSSLSSTYYNQYLYNSLGYTITVGNCLTSLPKLTLNKTTSLPYQIVAIPISLGAPAPPDGC